jgi:hypothetical protein
MGGPSPLLSLAESSLRTKELLCWNAEQRLRVHMRLCELLEVWRSDWGLSSPSSTIASQLTARQAERALSVHLFGAPTTASNLGSAYSESGIAQSIAQDAWGDWCSRLEKILGCDVLRGDKPAVPENNPWNGQLEIQLPWWSGTWGLDLPANSVQLLLGEAQASKAVNLKELPPLVSLGAAIAGELVRLEVRFNPITLTLGQVQALRFGDLVPIDHRLEDPIAVEIHREDTTAQLFCRAWLGQRDGVVAVELTH